MSKHIFGEMLQILKNGMKTKGLIIAIIFSIAVSVLFGIMMINLVSFSQISNVFFVQQHKYFKVVILVIPFMFAAYLALCIKFKDTVKYSIQDIFARLIFLAFVSMFFCFVFSELLIFLCYKTAKQQQTIQVQVVNVLKSRSKKTKLLFKTDSGEQFEMLFNPLMFRKYLREGNARQKQNVEAILEYNTHAGDSFVFTGRKSGVGFAIDKITPNLKLTD